MTAQLSPQRVGRITGSRIAPILGIGKYGSRDEVMREMVRQYFGAEPDFTGNDATEYGQAHEEDARAAYEQARGVLVLDAQDFVIHPDVDWLGVSPDGLVGVDGMVEVKCPPRARYATVGEVPHYAAQIQAQLACTGRALCDFVIWRSYSQADRLGVEPLIIERVPADPDWLPQHLGRLAEFHAEYLAIVADEERAAPFLAPLERTDEAWLLAATEYRQRCAVVAQETELLNAARDRLIELAGDASAAGCGVAVTRSTVRGSVDWKAIVEKHLPDLDVGEFRKPGGTRTTVKETAN